MNAGAILRELGLSTFIEKRAAGARINFLTKLLQARGMTGGMAKPALQTAIRTRLPQLPAVVSKGLPSPPQDNLSLKLPEMLASRVQPPKSYTAAYDGLSAPLRAKVDRLQYRQGPQQAATDSQLSRMQQLYSGELQAVKPVVKPPQMPPEIADTGNFATTLAGPPPTQLWRGVRPAELLNKPAHQPTWWSGHPEVSSGYASNSGGHSLLLKTPADVVAKQGPLGPFMPHLAKDSRGYGSQKVDAKEVVTAEPPGGNMEWSHSPYYERVGTQPNNLRQLLHSSTIYDGRPLPGEGYMSGDHFRMLSQPHTYRPPTPIAFGTGIQRNRRKRVY